MTLRPGRHAFFIDRGGTFTDCVHVDPTGRASVIKVLSTDDAPITAIRAALGLEADDPVPECDVRLGTTIATNALLERRGVPVTLFVTQGFGDLLELGDQTRPDLFALHVEKPRTLAASVVRVGARATHQGEILGRAGTELHGLEGLGSHTSAAVVVLFGHVAPELELELADELRAKGVRHISLSHEVDPKLGLLARAETTCVDAHLTPLLAEHVRALELELPGCNLRLMQSSGDLTTPAGFRGHNAILSGPAGGAVAVAKLADRLRLGPVIGLDIGGTSTDVSRYDGKMEPAFETRIAGVRLRTPMMDVHTVAAGGGSVCRHDGLRLSVGPQSCGAVPGPLSYGNPSASNLALTDVNLLLGRILPDRFPFALDVERPRHALQLIADAIGDGRSLEEVADGFLSIANAHVAEAIRTLTTQRGFDPSAHTLVAFGGAGGQHACAVARLLGIRRIVIHPLAGVFSAFGIGQSELGWRGQVDAGRDELTDGAIERLAEALDRLGTKADGPTEVEPIRATSLSLRYRGSEAELDVAYSPNDGAREVRSRFEEAHRRMFGYARPGHTVEITVARLALRWPTEPATLAPPLRSEPKPPTSTTRLWVGAQASHASAEKKATESRRPEGRWFQNVPVYDRELLVPGQSLRGPALVAEATGTIVIDPGFSLTVGSDGTLHLEDLPGVEASPTDPSLDPVRLELFGHAFDSIAEQMGVVLRRTAMSTNIRERLDFSCAIFDETGELVSNAPYIPVHLGAMGESVKAVIRAHPSMSPGDAFATNDPNSGGSHLPDITVVSPVFAEGGDLSFFTASRGHHADVGGVSPGSMPPFATSLAEEGVVLEALRITDKGEFLRDSVRARLLEGPYPVRRADENLADLEAQLAANLTGARLLAELVRRHGLQAVKSYGRHVMDHAAEAVRSALRNLRTGRFERSDQLDDGTPIRVTVEVTGAKVGPGLVIDFSGTGAEVAGNLNAPKAVTLSAVIYVIRALVGRPIPLNAGCLRYVEVRIPEPSVLAPSKGRAVAGGNVETSQRVVDVLLGALGLAAASQGTMNNLTFGDDEFGYYETIAGGSGATPDFAGASAVHTHMTNTRITDAEVLESRFPVRVIRHAVRRGSGGQGRHRGGDGVVRELELLRPLAVSILSERRETAPFGLEGGGPGERGRNSLDGRELGGKAITAAPAGSRLLIETPGGGGFGVPS
ncbi:MAG: hydantoinase B/oxoprolinase family protein [Deltaproteobacteria bacterium]|nr:hydantoinase B/oxoprolinase family protein [Deltaproteobacteria bacterium]